LFTQLAIVTLLFLIAYNTGVGKTLPVYHPEWMSCNGSLSRALFFSTLLGQNESMSKLALQVKAAGTIDEINRLVVNGSNIDAPRTTWFESVSEPGKCQAQIFLKNPNEDGNNTAYVGFEVAGFAAPNRSLAEVLEGGHVLESIQVSMIGVKWFRVAVQ